MECADLQVAGAASVQGWLLLLILPCCSMRCVAEARSCLNAADQQEQLQQANVQALEAGPEACGLQPEVCIALHLATH